tara:strand:+ start:3312 stop:4079 length:768 start_codon:yes stop_codon:yes gene_type:complete
MKAVILAGGFGTRISEETHLKPKPMIEIGGKPILWHIMKIYSSYGINEFIICCGYKGYLIKEYFANYSLHLSDVTFHMDTNQIEVHKRMMEDWKVTLVDTGEYTNTGGRLLRVKEYIKDTFCMTYGDGLSNVDIKELIKHHKNNGKNATLTAVKPPGRWGSLSIIDNKVKNFQEKPLGDGGWINGGFFVLEPEVFNLITDDKCIWEDVPLKTLAKQNNLTSYKHEGFWRAMDTLRDKKNLEELWQSNTPPWKIWE